MPRHPTEYRRQYGRRVLLARTAADLTQQQLGERLGLTRFSIANIEAGRQASSAEQVILTANALDCDPRWLLTGWSHDRVHKGRELPAPYEPTG